MITVGYAAFSTNLTITAKGNVKEKSRVIQSWSSTDRTDFHSEFYKQNIVNAEFLDNADVPSNATESWNVSEDKKHGGVRAWVVPNNKDNTKYDLYIGAKDGVIANENSSNIFDYFINLQSIKFNNNYDTSNVINMAQMFTGCTSLSDLDVSTFNTSNVIDMNNMFDDCQSLTELDITNFDTSNVKNMGGMFYRCINLKEIDVSKFDTSNVTSMWDMFSTCTNLTSLDLSNFNTSKVTTFHGMFYHCENLTTLDLSSFDTQNANEMNIMFSGCKKLEEINLCSFNTEKVNSMTGIFRATTNIKNIYVGPNWTTTQADTTDMFYGSGVSSVTTGQC